MSCVEDWRPSASLAALHERARLLAAVRAFFAGRGVMEVSTPVLCASTSADPALHCIRAHCGLADDALFLQPSPESPMKRLLAAGSGPIYQIGPVFRDLERGRLHNPEFTLLEWYRPGFDLAAVIDEVDALLAATLGATPGRRVRYRDAFVQALGLDPLTCDTTALARVSRDAGLSDVQALTRDGLLDFLFSRRVQPELGSGVVHVHDYPASQAAMARVCAGEGDCRDQPPTARRVEVFVDGVELANGYEELTDAREQRARFEAERREQALRGHETPPLDERLLAALEHGLPECAGMALGFDRLAMRALDAAHIDEVLSFPLERA